MDARRAASTSLPAISPNANVFTNRLHHVLFPITFRSPTHPPTTTPLTTNLFPSLPNPTNRNSTDPNPLLHFQPIIDTLSFLLLLIPFPKTTTSNTNIHPIKTTPHSTENSDEETLRLNPAQAEIRSDESRGESRACERVSCVLRSPREEYATCTT